MISKLYLLPLLTYLYWLSLNQLVAQASLNPSEYRTDSFYYSMLKKIELDPDSDSQNAFSVELNRIHQIRLDTLKEDSFFIRMKNVFITYPHEAYFYFFDLDTGLTRHHIYYYSTNYPTSLKLMFFYRDSIQKTYNKAIQHALTQVLTSHQKEELSHKEFLKRANASDYVRKKNAEINRANTYKRILRIDSIIKIHEYPGNSLVGKKYAFIASYIIQSGDIQSLEKYYPIIEKAMIEKNLDKSTFAFYLDRLLIQSGRKQIFGTQYKIEKGEIYFYPIGDPQSIDIRRKKYGLLYFKDTLKGIREALRKDIRSE